MNLDYSSKNNSISKSTIDDALELFNKKGGHIVEKRFKKGDLCAICFEEMNEEMHALAYFAGANSIFYGEKLLTTANPQANQDMALFERLGIRPQAREMSAQDPRFYDAAAS